MGSAIESYAALGHSWDTVGNVEQARTSFEKAHERAADLSMEYVNAFLWSVLVEHGCYRTQHLDLLEGVFLIDQDEEESEVKIEKVIVRSETEADTLMLALGNAAMASLSLRKVRFPTKATRVLSERAVSGRERFGFAKGYACGGLPQAHPE